ncbi:phosphate ABC transporter permease subunit PstC [Rhodobacteraceae bacterium]|nr:phosphate ABC transporter permease subunit PstC [Paracoccaceae bacterium]
MNSLIVFNLIVSVFAFFVCREKASRLREKHALLVASNTHWGWYGFLSVSIPTLVLGVLIHYAGIYFINSGIRSSSALEFASHAEYLLVKENVTASIELFLNEISQTRFLSSFIIIISYFVSGIETTIIVVQSDTTIEHLDLVVGAIKTKILALTATIVLGVIFALILAQRSINTVSVSYNAREKVEFVIVSLLALSSLIAVLTTVGIVISLLSETVNFAMMHSIIDFLFGTVWNPQFTSGEVEGYGSDLGILPLLWGTLYISFIALAFSVPIGLYSAIYLSEYASDRFRSLAKPVLELLAGIPTIVYGLFALLTVGPLLRDSFTQPLGLGSNSDSVLAAGLVMGIMLIPFVSSLSDDIINAVPQTLRDGSYGLGATQSETVKNVIIPAALPGIIGAVLLAASRAIGETMIVVLGAGAAAKLSLNPLEGMATITAKIVNQLTGDTEFESPETLVAFALGLSLFVITLCLNVLALYIVRKYREEYE